MGTYNLLTVKVEPRDHSDIKEAADRRNVANWEDNANVNVGQAPMDQSVYKAEDGERGHELEENAAVKKARQLAAPTKPRTGRRRYTSVGRETYGVDRDSGVLTTFHRSKLRYLLRTLMQQQKWHKACGVLGVLLGIPYSNSRAEDSRSDFAAAMEVLRRVEGVEPNDVNFRRMYRILSRQQPNARSRAKVHMDFALYLMSVGDHDAAYIELQPIVDGPIYREDPVMNFCHGFNSYCLWYKKAVEEISKLAVPEVRSRSQNQESGPVEGIGENESPEAVYHGIHQEGVRTPEDKQADQSGAMDIGPDSDLWQTSQKSIYEETDEQGFVQNGDQFWRSITVPSSQELDRRLFPVLVPTKLRKKHYSVPMEDGRTRDLHAAAVKHLKQALATAPDMLPALLPLVQLLLAVHDVKGAVDEIDKCSKALTKHCIPPSIKVALLESLDQKDSAQLASCYRDVLVRNPLSLSSLRGLVNLHASGNIESEVFLEYLCLHLDVDPGAVDIWKKLATALLDVGERLQQLSSGDIDMKIVKENIVDIEGEFGPSTMRYLSRDYLRRLWRGRYSWWLSKHFRKPRIEIEEQANGDPWLLAYQAACANHIYGPKESFVENACIVLRRHRHDQVLSLLRHHCQRSLKLFVNRPDNDHDS